MRAIIVLCLILLCFVSCKEKESVKRQPNIILILSDDQGWGDLSMNGNTNLSTPHIDNIGNNGATFDRFYVSAVCSPTRAEILTGRYSPRTGVYSTSAGGERIDLDEVTIADILKKAGYATAAYGKWHSGMQPPYHPNARGFDDYYGFCSGHWGNYYSPMLEHNGAIVKGNGFLTDDLTDHGLEFMEKNKEQPFFLYLPFNTPHSPMQVPDKYWNRFKDKSLEMTFQDPAKEDLLFTKSALAMVENIDWNVGRVVEKVEALGLAENTIIIYLSDNGPNGNRWNDGMKGRKGSTDEGGVRSPMVIQWTGQIDSGKRIQQIASGIDFLPTLTDLANVEFKSENQIDGVSLKPLLIEEEPIWEDRLIYNLWKDRLSVRSQKYRLDHENNLFDMESDPGQKHPLGTDSEVYRQFVTAKKNWQSTVAMELPMVEDRSFVIGHPDYVYTQIPARDAQVTGKIQRSNRWPNNSFFMNWINVKDEIYWDAEVLADGKFEVEIYYTCPKGDEGSLFELSFGESRLEARIDDAHDPPLLGAEEDRYPRMESYVKDFKPMKMGVIELKKGKGRLTLKPKNIKGRTLMDFRLLMLKRV